MELEIDDEEGTEVIRQSLLDIVLDKKQKQGKARLEDRITLLAKTKGSILPPPPVRSVFVQ